MARSGNILGVGAQVAGEKLRAGAPSSRREISQDLDARAGCEQLRPFEQLPLSRLASRARRVGGLPREEVSGSLLR